MKVLMPKEDTVLSPEQLLRDALRVGVYRKWYKDATTEDVNGFIESMLDEIKLRFHLGQHV